MDPVKIGLVGYGFGGRYFHAPLIAASPECEFIGVVTSSAARRALVGAEHPAVDVFDDSGFDDDVFVALRHTNGAVSHLWGSWSQHAPGLRFRVTGSAATLVVTTTDTQEEVLVSGTRPSTDAPWGVEQSSDLDRVFTPSGSRPVSLEPGAWDTYYPAFARAVRGEGSPPVAPVDAVATADVLEAARVSIERRTTERLGAER